MSKEANNLSETLTPAQEMLSDNDLDKVSGGVYTPTITCKNCRKSFKATRSKVCPYCSYNNT